MQTYEGGLGGEPGNEAHGGYTFCGLAALVLIKQAHQLDLPRLIHWAVHMQVSACPSLKLPSAIFVQIRQSLFSRIHASLPEQAEHQCRQSGLQK